MASLWRPYNVAVNSIGEMFIADTWNNVVRKVSSNGVISTVAGIRMSGLTNARSATAASLFLARSVGLSPNGDIFTSDNYNTVRKVILATFLSYLFLGGVDVSNK